MDVEYPVRDLDPEASYEEEEEMEDLEEEEEEEEEEKGSRRKLKSGKKVAREHKTQLQRLKEKDPEFYKFLEENDKELLEFNDEDFEEDVDADMEIEQMQEEEENPSKSVNTTESKGIITTAMVDSWCMKVQENGNISALRSLLKAFRVACHYGDDSGEDLSSKFSVMPSIVFNKVMLFALCEMDGILRNLLGLPSSGGRKENITDMMTTKKWKNYSHLVKSYLGNALHVLKQMTDTEMISFTVRRLKYSSLLLAAFPSLLRKYIKVVLHFWGTGGGALPVVSFLFLRELCIRIGSDCLDECFKGIYKAYVLNCQFINAVKLQHIQFLGNCVVELFQVDIPTAYQHAFVFIRQLAMILRDAITMKTKESYRKVYEWKFINCLELWTGAICAYSSETDFRPLAYPLIQVISGVARLVPTAQYFPLRLRCVQMLNRIAASTGTFVPVSMLLLDMLEMKELNRPPTGGVGTAVDLRTIIKVKKDNLKTRAFQEACVMSVVEELAEHLAQWSYSVAFFELSFIPAVRLRSFSKTTKVERFRKEMRHFIRQIEANCKFTNERRASITFLPNDPAAASFLEDEKKSGVSPLSQYVATLRERAQQRKDSLQESSVIVGANSAVFGKKLTENDDDNDKNNKGAAVFSSSWLPGGEEKAKPSSKEERKKKKKKVGKQEVALEEDVVEDLVLSSDDEEGSSSVSGSSAADEHDENKELVSPEQQSKKKQQKLPSKSSKKKSRPKKSKKKSSGTPCHHHNGKVDDAKVDQPAGKRTKKGGGPPAAISSENDAQSRANKSKKRKRASR